MTDESCCLCFRDVATGHWKKRRRLLNGRACLAARTCLDTVLQENNLDISQIPWMSCDESYICNACKSSIENLTLLQDRVAALKQQILESITKNIQFSQLNTDGAAATPELCRKRRIDDTYSSTDGDQQSLPPTVSPSVSIDSHHVPPNQYTPQRPTRQSRVKLTIMHPSGEKTIPVDSPWRQENIKRVAQGRYHALSLSVAGSERTEDLVIDQVIKNIKQEFKDVCSESHDSILRDSHEAVKRFSWDTVWLELVGKTPTLIKLLSGLVTSPEKSKPFICLVACMLIKKKLSKLSLVQKIISIYLYGNGTHKKVYDGLQPFMITMSHSAIIKMIDKISEDYDEKVYEWSDNQCEFLKNKDHVGCDARTTSGTMMGEEQGDEDDDDENEDKNYDEDFDPMIDFDPITSFLDHDSPSEESAIDEENDIDHLVTSTSAIPIHQSHQPFSHLTQSYPVTSTPQPHSPYYSLQTTDLSSNIMSTESINTSHPITCTSHTYSTLSTSESHPVMPQTQPLISTSDNCLVVSTAHSTPCSSHDYNLAVSASGTNNAHANSTLSTTTWKGFKLIGDNIDKNIHRSFQRLTYSSLSLHYFHSFALLDRIDLSGLSDEPPNGEVDFNTIVPSMHDIRQLKDYFVVFVSRILKDYFKADAQFVDSNSIQWHIPHKYSKEMSLKSVCVLTGVQLQNENKLDEMCIIMSELQKYCPIMQCNTQSEHATNHKCWEVLFGGDQLTRPRAVSAIRIRSAHDDLKDQLTAFIPVVEDWHARLTLMKVIWKRMFYSKSVKEKGTLYQLKNLLNRSSVPPDPSQNMKACEDFFMTVLVAYVVLAAKKVMSDNQSENSYLSLATKIVDNFVHINLTELPSDSDDDSDDDASACMDSEVHGEEESIDDGIHVYASEVLTLGLLWHCFHDASREGDGDRIMLIWKFLLLIFKQTNRKNYSIEAAMLLLQRSYFFSPRKAEQLKWSRFVNTSGKRGHNIPCDLHMEHLNRRIKDMFRHLGSNLQPKVIKRAGKCVGLIHNICTVFEKETKVKIASWHHGTPSFHKDLQLILNDIEDMQVFQKQNGRKYNAFNLKKPLLVDVSKDKIMNWLINNVAPKLLF